jgi:N utilization substance protein B
MKGMGNRRKARILAFQALYSWDISSVEAEELLQFDWTLEDNLDEVKIFAGFLIKGTIENVDEIDTLIKDSLKKWDFDRLEKVSLAILRMSIYALLYQKDIPPKVVIDEAVEITKEYGTDDSYRFVNGILDNIKKKLYEQNS